jgi:hypothetical protein
MFTGELLGTNPISMNMEQVRRLPKFGFVFGDDRSGEDHARSICGQVFGEPLAKASATPEASS